MITVPIWPEFVIPILQVSADGQIRPTRDLRPLVFSQMQLSEEALSEKLASGESRATNRFNWAISHAHRAHWIERVSRGHYRLTDAGREALTTYPDGFHDYHSADLVLEPFWRSEKEADIPEATVPPLTVDPTEQVEGAVAELNAQVASELLDRLRTSDPSFFEEAVVRLLLAMGYGGAEQRGQRIGGTGDGGVDGVIDQDALGLDQIYVQAKRYAEGNNVGRETIQAFIGALAGRGASRGVFITSSDFTPNAVSYADNIPTRISLINGHRLTSLMIKYRVGVQTRQTYEVVELDEDFFE